MQEKNEKGQLRHKILTIVGIVLCVILVPILIINCTLLVKGMVNDAEVPDFGGIMPLIVYTDSMHGVFEMGDLIICKTIDPEDVQDQDIIAFFDPAGNGTSIVTHRVIGFITAQDGSRSFITKGDANNTQDTKAVPAKNLVGKYIDIRIPNAGHVALFMQSTLGLILCVFVPLVALVAYDMIRRRLYERQHADDKDELLRELEELRRLKQAQAEVAAEEPPAEAPPGE